MTILIYLISLLGRNCGSKFGETKRIRHLDVVARDEELACILFVYLQNATIIQLWKDFRKTNQKSLHDVSCQICAPRLLFGVKKTSCEIFVDVGSTISSRLTSHRVPKTRLPTPVDVEITCMTVPCMPGAWQMTSRFNVTCDWLSADNAVDVHLQK